MAEPTPQDRNLSRLLKTVAKNVDDVMAAMVLIAWINVFPDRVQIDGYFNPPHETLQKRMKLSSIGYWDLVRKLSINGWVERTHMETGIWWRVNWTRVAEVTEHT